MVTVTHNVCRNSVEIPPRIAIGLDLVCFPVSKTWQNFLHLQGVHHLPVVIYSLPSSASPINPITVCI